MNYFNEIDSLPLKKFVSPERDSQLIGDRIPHTYRLQVQGGPSARGLGYVDINSVSFSGYLETELSQQNTFRKQMGHPVHIY